MRVQCDFTITLPALGIKNFTAQPPVHNQGSHADIYLNPNDPNTLIKITNHSADADNIVAAQTLSSPNILKCHAHTTQGVVGGTALLVDYVKGHRAVYSTPEFLGLIEGQQGSDPRDQGHVRIMRPDQFRSGILQSHGLLTKTELAKLSQLFSTISLLERQLGIFLVDFSENVIDAGPVYVIVDLGR